MDKEREEYIKQQGENTNMNSNTGSIAGHDSNDGLKNINRPFVRNSLPSNEGNEQNSGGQQPGDELPKDSLPRDDLNQNGGDQGNNQENASQSNQSSGEGGEANGDASQKGNSSFSIGLPKIKFDFKLVMKILPFASQVMGIFLLMIAILYIVSGPVDFANQIFETVLKPVGDFFESVGNLFTGNGFNTNEEAAKEAEKKFYEKIDEVKKDYKDKYSIDIDADLITATLFYNKTMATAFQNADESDLNYDEDTKVDFGKEKDYYKIAKNSVDPLAKMQILKTTVKNSCTHNPSEVKYELEDKSEEEIAKEASETKEWIFFTSIANANATNVVMYEKKLNDAGIEEDYCPYGEDGSTTESYSLNIAEEGVYYHRLYYDDVIKNLHEAQGDGDDLSKYNIYEIIDDIYSVYKDFQYVDSVDYEDCYEVLAVQNSISPKEDSFIDTSFNNIKNIASSYDLPLSVVYASARSKANHGYGDLISKANNYFAIEASECIDDASKVKINGEILNSSNELNKCSGNQTGWDGSIIKMGDKFFRVYSSYTYSFLDYMAILTSDSVSCGGKSATETMECINNSIYRDQYIYDEFSKSEKIRSIDSLNSTTEGDTSTDSGRVKTMRICPPGTTGTYGSGSVQGTTTVLADGKVYTAREDFTVEDAQNKFFNWYGSTWHQCVLYSKGRAVEILYNAGVVYETAKKLVGDITGNAWDFYEKNQTKKYFSASTDYTKPKVGAIVTWKRGKSGHIGIVEKIDYDSLGNITGVWVSEGNSGTKVLHFDKAVKDPDGTVKKTYRFNYSKFTLEGMSNLGGRTNEGQSYTFIGYIYLLDYS